jgi:hypothetical protein
MDITIVGQSASPITKNVQISQEAIDTAKLHLYVSVSFSPLVTKNFIIDINTIVGNR